MTRRRAAMPIALTLLASATGGYALLRSPRRTPVPIASSLDTSRPAPSARAADVRPVVPSVLGADVRAAADAVRDAAAGDDAVTALRRGLASDDESVRIAAVEAAVEKTSIETLLELESFDLRGDPEAAPTVIHAIALLGASADGEKREHAVGTLARWLREEQGRDGPDVPGNVSNLVEAIGDAGGANAVDALDAALDEDRLPLHVQTLAVQKLGELADGRSRGSVERFAARVSTLPPTDGLEEELRVEAIDAARTTLSKI